MIRIDRPLDMHDPDAERFLRTIQGNILKGHGRPHTKHLFLRFKKDQRRADESETQHDNLAYTAARAELAKFARKENMITSAWQQQEDIAARHDFNQSGRPFVMFLLSAKGYEALSIDNRHTPTDAAFRAGIKGSLGQNQLEEPYEAEFHAMILMAHEDRKGLEDLERVIEGEISHFCEIVHREEGNRISLENTPRSVEHFHFADGISNPLLITQEIEEYRQNVGMQPQWDPAANLNLVLVPEPFRLNDAPLYGSYMVFYKLQQHVDLFKQTLDENMAPGAVGRLRDGRPLADLDTNNLDNFTYRNDPDGKKCPVNAHIRIMNNRSGSPQIVRRGITYGEPATEAGLLFMSFQASIRDQFEALQQLSSGDALIGPRQQGMSFVTPRGGEYFYAPSIPFLQRLDKLRRDQAEKFRRAWDALLRNPDTLRQFAEAWQVNEIAGAGVIGVNQEDMATLYASYQNINMDKIREGRAKLDNLRIDPTDLTDEQRERLSGALSLLLNPQTLEDFIGLWPDDPVRALALIGLEPQDMINFYMYLEQGSGSAVVLDWPLWL